MIVYLSKSSMRSGRLSLSALLVVGALCAILLLQTAAGQEGDLQPSARSQFKLPKLFDFSRFKGLFKKSYKSIIEAAVRQKLFMARAFRAFCSAIKYKNNKSSYYLKVNEMSDYTPKELQTLYSLIDSSTNGEPVKMNEEEPVELIDTEDVDRELREVQARANEDGYREIARELNLNALNGGGGGGGQKASAGSRKRRDVNLAAVEKNRRNLMLDDLMGTPDSEAALRPEVQLKVRRIVPSNNPRHVIPEMPSYGDKGEDEDGPLELVDDEYMSGIVRNNEKVVPKGRSLLGNLVSFFKKDNNNNVASNPDDQSSQLADVVYVDHRKSNCFFEPRRQNGCGSCYAFSWVSYLEYLNCKATETLTAFSEQYIIDCGSRAKLDGCNGGSLSRAGLFIKEYGLELRELYPYKRRLEQCPYDQKAKPQTMGYIRFEFGIFPVSNQAADLEKNVRLTPIIVGVATSADFHEYGGGVHQSEGCGPKATHGMLLVGHGREDGQEYWLIRNSHGISYGEGGYYKLAKSANCIRGTQYVLADRKTKKVMIKPVTNSENDRSIIKDKYVPAEDSVSVFGRRTIRQ